MSDVVTEEKVRELSSLEIMLSFKFTADPYAVQVTLLSIGESTDGCRVKEHVIVRDSPARGFDP